MLTVSGTVYRSLTLTPKTLSMGKTAIGTDINVKAYLACEETVKGISVEEIGGNALPISVTVTPITVQSATALVSQPNRVLSKAIDRKYVVHISIRTSDLKEGEYDGTLKLTVNPPRGVSTFIPYRFTVSSPIVICPQIVFLGRLEAYSERIGEVKLWMVQGEKFQILSLVSDIEDMTAKYSTDVSRESRMEWRYVSNDEVKKVDGTIKVTCLRLGDSKTKAKVKIIPVYGYAPPTPGHETPRGQ